MMKKLLFIVILFCMALSLTSCGMLDSIKEQLNETSSKTESIESSENSSSILEETENVSNNNKEETSDVSKSSNSVPKEKNESEDTSDDSKLSNGTESSSSQESSSNEALTSLNSLPSVSPNKRLPYFDTIVSYKDKRPWQQFVDFLKTSKESTYDVYNFKAEPLLKWAAKQEKVLTCTIKNIPIYTLCGGYAGDVSYYAEYYNYRDKYDSRMKFIMTFRPLQKADKKKTLLELADEYGSDFQKFTRSEKKTKFGYYCYVNNYPEWYDEATICFKYDNYLIKLHFLDADDFSEDLFDDMKFKYLSIKGKKSDKTSTEEITSNSSYSENNSSETQSSAISSEQNTSSRNTTSSEETSTQ